MNNERFFKANCYNGSLVEVLGLYKLTQGTNPKNFVSDNSIHETEIIGDTIYSPEPYTDDIGNKVDSLLNGSHLFAKKAQELYNKYNPEFDNALDFITADEFKELRDTIDFKYTTIANVLLLIGRRILCQKNIGLDFGISVYESEKEHCLYKYDFNNYENLEKMSLEDFKLLLQKGE